MPNGIRQIYQHLQVLTKKDEYVLTVESTGSLEPGHVIMAGIEELGRRLDEFKEILVDLKE